MAPSTAFEHAVGDCVWVRTGLGTHEEPATVLELDVELPNEKDAAEGSNGEKNAANGVRVRFNVSFYEGIFPASKIRFLRAESNTQGSRRRSPRSVSPMPNKCVASPVSTGSTARQQVTPSPTTCSTSDTSDTSTSTAEKGEQKRPSKRKRHTKSDSSKPTAKSTKKFKSEPATKKPVAKKDELKKSKVKKTASRASKKETEPSSPYFDDEAKKKTQNTKSKEANKALKKTKSGVAVVESPSVASASGSGNNLFGDPSDDDDDSEADRPFRVEYSKTGRATCRTCDEMIAKGDARIAHTPLFRGKPGYQVYRHLHCAIFSEEIDCAEDVGGYSKLSPEDYVRLAARVEESKEEVKREAEELEPDQLVPVVFQGETRPVPQGLTANLLPFQVEGASWMYHQEVKEPELRSGILADEMGMGKTLQTIVTILDNKPKLQHSKPGAKHPPSPDRDLLVKEDKLWDDSLAAWKHEMDMNNVPASLRPKARGKQPGGGARAGTLVVCPVIALSQWKSEIEKFSEAGALTVGTYHGPNRSSQTPRQLLTKYDVVLTTYQVLEADFRKMVSPNKVKCPNCGGKFKVDKLRVHLKYFCGEGAQRTEAQARQRRNRDRQQGRRPDNAFGGKKGGSQKKKTMTKSFSTKTSKPLAKKQVAKRAVRVSHSAKYDSESDLSVEVETPTSRGRPSRSAAVTASKRMSSSKKEWGSGTRESDSEEYEDVDMTSSDESSDEEVVARKPVRSKVVSPAESEDGDSSEESSSDEDDALQRAREKQRQALQRARSTKGKKGKASKKKTMKDAKGKKKTGKKVGKKGGKKRKKGFDSSSLEDSSDEERDALEGIDMDRLVQEAMEGSVMSPLHSLCWWRIVLDEAHFIKSRSSQTAAAAFALIGIHRWCLSGTPLQNRVGEFYSLIRFLRIDPMAHYFCKAKGCDCKSLHYRMLNGRCQSCGHGSIQHFSHFNKHVLNPIQRDGYSGDGRRAMFKLKNEILDRCLLRRTKENRAADMNLPPRLVNIRSVRLHPVEEDFYNALYTQTSSSFNDYVADGTLLNNYAHIFDLLMRMRQAVDHPYLVVYSKKDAGKRHEDDGPAVANGSTDCNICHEPPTERVVSSCCQDAFCRSCVLEYMSTLGAESTPCPSCGAAFSIDLSQASSVVVDDNTLSVDSRKGSGLGGAMPSLKELAHVATGSILRRINLAEFATSSKIEALTQELVRMRQTSPGSKAIVFSQFVNMLDLIRWRLHSDPCLASMGLGARALHGGMDVKARDASLKDFREDNRVRVLLMSLKAGGVALNLTVANHIFLMDPWWNPASEMQAIDRTHRLGQYRPIRAVRFIAENTVEERILQLQEKKRLVFDGTVGRDAGSLKMLTVDDMKSLFA